MQVQKCVLHWTSKWRLERNNHQITLPHTRLFVYPVFLFHTLYDDKNPLYWRATPDIDIDIDIDNTSPFTHYLAIAQYSFIFYRHSVSILLISHVRCTTISRITYIRGIGRGNRELYRPLPDVWDTSRPPAGAEALSERCAPRDPNKLCLYHVGTQQCCNNRREITVEIGVFLFCVLPTLLSCPRYISITISRSNSWRSTYRMDDMMDLLGPALSALLSAGGSSGLDGKLESSRTARGEVAVAGGSCAGGNSGSFSSLRSLTFIFKSFSSVASAAEWGINIKNYMQQINRWY